jgi:transposase-like protein
MRAVHDQRYERTEVRRDTRGGRYERKLQTRAGEAKLRAATSTYYAYAIMRR